MSYKIVVDSSGELTDEMKKSGDFQSVALSLLLGDENISDDENFNQSDFLKKMASSEEAPKSACPSPEEYMKSYSADVDRIYVVTLSSELSGSYNSAQLGMQVWKEENGDKKIHIFNSRSASVGETLIALKIQDCEAAGMEFEQVVNAVESYIEGQKTFFVLESLDTLRKSGRLTGIKSLMASTLNIKPIMGSTPEGTIYQVGQERGIKKALSKMVEQVVASTKNPEGKILGISHVNNKQRALEVQESLLEKIKVKDSFIIDTAGISTMYASDGGIIVAI